MGMAPYGYGQFADKAQSEKQASDYQDEGNDPVNASYKPFRTKKAQSTQKHFSTPSIQR
jgi:hypothetical protein